MKQIGLLITLLFIVVAVKAQDDMLCMGKHWTEDEANLVMKQFSSEWDDLDSWQDRAKTIKKGIVSGMKLNQMPKIEGNFNPIIRSRKEMDGYVVENVAIESFPVFLGLNFFGNHTIHSSKDISLPTSYIRNNENFFITDNKATEASRGVRGVRWPVERIIERGYGLVAIYYGDIDPDFDDDFQNGIHKLFHEDNKKPKPNEWGSIAAWSYGLSKAMDYLVTDESIDKNKVAVIGHSRLGKTSLWAGATDERFALTVSNDSGCGGAALSKRRQGETVKKINDRFPHWFNDNFTSYNDKEDELPIDQHMLISLMAPRPVYVGSAEEDKWADPMGEYLSTYHAGEVYRLYGFDVFESNQSPKIDEPRMVGKMGYHIRTGRHNLTYYDWEKYMDFADIHF